MPSFDIQRRIVARIDELFAELDDGEAALARARSELETYRKALLKAAVTGELTADWRAANPPKETGAELLKRILSNRRDRWHAEPKNRGKKYKEPLGPDATGLPVLPEGWAWATSEQIARYASYGTSTKCSATEDGVPVLRMGNIQDGLLSLSKLKFAPASVSVPTLSPGDVLFNRTNSPELVGKTAVFDVPTGEYSYASYLVALRLDGLLPEFFSGWMNSLFGKQWIADNRSQQVGQANVSAGKLLRMAIPVPPHAEQETIVQLVKFGLESSADMIDTEFEAESAILRQSILAAAFRGELVQ